MISKYANNGSHCDTYLPKPTQAKVYYCKHPLTKLNSRGDVITLFDLRSEEDDD